MEKENPDSKRVRRRFTLIENYGVTMTLGSDITVLDEGGSGTQMLKLPRAQTTLGNGLQVILAQRGCTFLVKKSGLEVVQLETAAQQAKSQLDVSGPTQRLKSPLVSAVIVEKPLNEALAALSEDHDVTVIVAPQAGDAKSAFVSARLLNVPLDNALELLALQADLRVIRRGNAYFLTSPDQANQIRTEKLEHLRQQQSEVLNPPLPPAPPAPGEKGK